MDSDPNCLRIGLVNNMPDSALAATERQFVALLEAAAGSLDVRLAFYALPDVPRGESGKRHVSAYCSINDLWNCPLDGLIVTGTEPRAEDLTQEPYWASMVRLLEWADDNTTSAVWSCLAAHAAVLHVDGIRRRRLPEKRFGIFDCARVDNHSLTADGTNCLRMPHSRWNDVPEEALQPAGYRILTRSDAGVDAFMKQQKSLFVFFQGHPEYEADTLLLEYRRDVKRFLRRESDTYPNLPKGYFDTSTTAAWTAIKERALSNRSEDLIADFPQTAAETAANTWLPDAARVYRNWLSYMSSQKSRRLQAKAGVLLAR
jgi:homoserine O-succinyltransferase